MPELRLSTPADDAAQASWVASAEEVERFAGPSLTFPITPEQLQAHRDDPAITAFVAFLPPDEATPIARVDLVRVGDPADAAGRVSRVLIAPSHRGRGHSRPILTAIIDHARATGLKVLELHVFKDNIPAIRTYEHLGFTVISDAPDPRQHTMRLQ
jgi:RimJ/RimL family protein N-acetyltransferase